MDGQNLSEGKVELLTENLNTRRGINLESKALKCMPSPVIGNNASTDALQYEYCSKVTLLGACLC